MLSGMGDLRLICLSYGSWKSGYCGFCYMGI